MLRALRLVLVLAAGALWLTGEAAALECPSATMRQRIDAADAVFVGTLVSSRPVAGGERVYRFDVAQPVKGPLGTEVEIRAPLLVDANDDPVANGVDAGVLATLDGAEFVTDSCGLTNPALLLAEADEPRGGWIKLLIGAVILGAVLVYALTRLKRRTGASARGNGAHRPG